MYIMPWQSHAIFVEWFNRWHQANPGYGRSGPWRFERHRSQPALIQCPGRKESVAPGWYPGGTPLGQRSEGLNAFQLAVGPHWLLTLPWHAPSLASNRWWVWRKLKASQGARRSKQETHCDIFSGRWNHTVFFKGIVRLQGSFHWAWTTSRENPQEALNFTTKAKESWRLEPPSIPSRCFPKSCGGALAPGAGGQPPRHSNWGLIRIDFNKF